MKLKKKNTNPLFCSYEGLRGVDFTGKRKDCFSNLENMYVDYSAGGGCVESIPGFRRLYAFGEKVFSIFLFDGWIFIHAGDGLYRFMERERNQICALKPIAKMPRDKSPIVSLGGFVFALGDEAIIRISPDGAVTNYTLPPKIKGCFSGAIYDGRLFLSQKEMCPHRIYYFNFDCDGAPDFEHIGQVDVNARVNSMLCTKDGLLIFNDMGVCCIEGIGGEYAAKSILSTDPCYASACFAGEALFVTDNGVFSAEGAECLSNEILPKLAEVKMQNAHLTAWCGYLALCCDGKIFLADPRLRSRGDGEGFDWYYLRRIGTYKKDERVYRYSPVAEDGFYAYGCSDAAAEGIVMSLKDSAGRIFYYTEQDGKKYSLYPTEEFVGGDYSPAGVFVGRGELLFFATESGDLCLFNNDMRGAAPPYLSTENRFDDEEYKRINGSSIHPCFYSFASHSANYALDFPPDSLGLPCARKRTLPKSLCVRLKNHGRSSLTVLVRCDGRIVSETPIRFGCLDFSQLDFSGFGGGDTTASFTLTEHAHGWKSKQISIYGNEFCAPIGVYSASYCYKAESK